MLADPPGVSVMLDEPKLSLGPEGTEVADRETVPAKPLMLARVIVTEPELPCGIVIEDVSTARLKSWTFTVTRTEWAIDPLVPVTLTE